MRKPAISLAACVVLVVAAAGCSPSEPRAEQTIDALIVGSPTPLSLADTGFLTNIDEAQAVFAQLLGTFWDSYNDLAEDASPAERQRWLDSSTESTEAMSAELNRLEIDLFLTESAELRETFAPYLLQWVAVIQSLEVVQEGVRENDQTLRDSGAAAYARDIAAVADADFERVARVVRQLEPGAARDFLESQNLNPAEFGL